VTTFQPSGKIPLSNDLLNKIDRGIDINFIIMSKNTIEKQLMEGLAILA